MAYVKNTWVDREGQTRYHETIDDDGALIFTPDYEKITEMGTPVNADNMNHIEDGIVDHENRITILEEAGDASNFLNKTQITNCLLEVPQRIKLELNNGTLTLKAGSVVIVPNGKNADGSLKFDYVTIESDISATNQDATTIVFYITYSSTSPQLYNVFIGSCASGSGKGNGLYYSTDENKMFVNGIDIQASLPIAIATSNTTAITSIDQVFNGIGYIGSTIWVDKGVKCLVPNGRNEDGTLNNIEYTVESLRTVSQTASNSNLRRLFISIDSWGAVFNSNYFEGKDGKQPTTTAKAARIYYAYDTNITYLSSANTTIWEKVNFAEIAKLTCSTTAVLTLNPKTTFRALDYNDKSEISGYAMPSNKYIDLTLGASGTAYTAPANGWLCFAKQASATNQRIALFNFGSQSDTMLGSCAFSSGSSQGLHVFVPTKKGDGVSVQYNAGGTNIYFRFIYAQGEV